MDIEIKSASVDSEDAKMLISELNQALTVITGDDGTTNFHREDVLDERSAFLIAYIDGIPYGCGAIRQVSEDTAEAKRIYARKNQYGVGKAILKALETKAIEFGYHRIILETRVQNLHAIEFYHKNGYDRCEAYGKYVGKDNAYCFQKAI